MPTISWTTPSPSPPTFRRPSPRTFAGRVQAMPLRSKVSALIGVAALAGVVYAMTAWNASGDYKVLYANLADKDGGAVIAQLVADERALPHVRRRRGDPRAGGTSSRPAPEDGDRRPAEGRGLRLRADGQRPLRPDPVPGAAHVPARPRRRADALDLLARRGAGGARAPRAAEPERLLSRAAEAERLGAADAAPGPHARSRRRSPASSTSSRRAFRR